ncbi:MAG: hypothetical protein LRY69_01065 [Gammaproteobacteria bacterium]|nr:hypothetical protein [Gammaproteobacteria bacterium]
MARPGQKISYLTQSWDAEALLSCQQIIQGIDMLVNDNVPLPDVQGEIIDYATARGVVIHHDWSDAIVESKLTHLLHDAWVNSSTVLSKMARTVTVQADLFLNRLTQSGVTFDRFDARQICLFESNVALFHFIKKSVEGLKNVLTSLPHPLKARISSRLDKLSVDEVLERYVAMSPNQGSESTLVVENAEILSTIDIDPHEDQCEEEEAFFDEPVFNEPASEEKQEAVSPPTVNCGLKARQLEPVLLKNEELLQNIMRSMASYRLQLSCFSRIKACYAKFSLFPVFRKIGAQLSSHQTVLINALSELQNLGDLSSNAPELNQQLSAVIKSLEHNLERVKSYLATLGLETTDYNVITEITPWQSKLYELIFRLPDAELEQIEARLQRIQAMQSPYLRAALIMKLDKAKMKLNDLVMANMQSWSSRFVDRETVENTLKYLGIHVHPSYISKIAPTIHIPKKNKTSKKNFYAIAADYGMGAWRQMRNWLDKPMIG